MARCSEFTRRRLCNAACPHRCPGRVGHWRAFAKRSKFDLFDENVDRLGGTVRQGRVVVSTSWSHALMVLAKRVSSSRSASRSSRRTRPGATGARPPRRRRQYTAEAAPLAEVLLQRSSTSRLQARPAARQAARKRQGAAGGCRRGSPLRPRWPSVLFCIRRTSSMAGLAILSGCHTWASRRPLPSSPRTATTRRRHQPGGVLLALGGVTWQANRSRECEAEGPAQSRKAT